MNSLAGTGSLIRLVLRRERVQLPVWIVLISLVVISTAASFVGLYPTAQSRLVFAASIEHNPGYLALTGPAFDLSTIGGITAWRVLGIGGVLVALMAVFTLVRHTRTDEEAGRLELIESGVVGRAAPLTAALAVVLSGGLALGSLTAFGLLAQGLPAAGSFAIGLGLAGVAWVFAGITAVAAQLGEYSRTAIGLSSAVVGVVFAVRAAADSAGPAWLSWFSPIGWSQQLRPFAGERWWVLGLFVALTAVLLAVAYVLVSRRDIGAGLLPARPGPASAGRGLRGTLGLAWRLHRGPLLGWVIAAAVLGAASGALAQGVSDIVNSSAQLAQIFAALGGGQAIVDAFLSVVMGVVGLIAAIYAVQATMRLRGEETAQRAEPLLAAAVGRTRWAASHLLFSILGTAVLLTAAGLAAGLTHGLRTGDVGTQLPRVLAAALVQVPAAWVLAGIGIALFGLLPRLTSLAWAALVLFLLLGQLGPLLRLSQWVLDVSPFTHVPKLPGGDFSMTPMAWLVAVTVILTVGGLVGFRRRDIG